MKPSTKIILSNMLLRYPGLETCSNDIVTAFSMLHETYKAGGMVLTCGNGGSAADAEHIVGELMKSFRKRRPILATISSALRPELAAKLEGALPAVSLVSMCGIVSAFSNDVDWDAAFAQQVLGLAKPGDALVALSTSGNSANCVAAAEVAKATGAKTIALTGANASRLSEICDVTIQVPESETYKIQELHLPVYHALCAMLEEELF